MFMQIKSILVKFDFNLILLELKMKVKDLKLLNNLFANYENQFNRGSIDDDCFIFDSSFSYDDYSDYSDYSD